MKPVPVLLAVAVFVALVVLGLRQTVPQPSPAESPPLTAAANGGEVGTEELAATEAAPRGFLYGRVATHGGATYEGRLRWGGNQEAFWNDYFHGSKKENPWVTYLAPGELRRERRSIKIFGHTLAEGESEVVLDRPFLTRFGDIVGIESQGRDVWVTLKSGTVVELDRREAGDFDDGVRVWDRSRGVVDLDSRQIRTIELLPTARLSDAPERRYGMVRTRQGDFEGFVCWDRDTCLGTDELVGQIAEGKLRLRFDAVRSIERRSADSAKVTLLTGREVLLSDHRSIGERNRGIYVDDRRYGRVRITWDVFDRLDFEDGGVHDSGRRTTIFGRGARFAAPSSAVPLTNSLAGWSSTSTKARRRRLWTHRRLV